MLERILDALRLKLKEPPADGDTPAEEVDPADVEPLRGDA